MPLPGYRLVSHLKNQIPDLSDATIASWAGVSRQRVTDWSAQRIQGGPQHAEIIQLGRAAEQAYPAHDVGPFSLLEVAGFEYVPPPWEEHRRRLLVQWAELTLQLQDADIVTLRRVVRAAQKAVKKSTD